MEKKQIETQENELEELRCVHELARQLLPLHAPEDVARDGLLCIAGITCISSGAVLWRSGARESLTYLSHFGLRNDFEALEIALSGEIEDPWLGQRQIRWTKRHRSRWTDLDSLREAFSEAWVMPLIEDRRLRGLLVLGPSLITGQLLPQSGLAVDLAEILRLALVGCEPTSLLTHKAAQGPAARSQNTSSVAERFAELQARHPETQEFIGASEATLQLLEEIVSLADTDYTVMIQGETGTGKELAATLLHRLSRRAKGAFEAVDCSSIPQELIESELFGHVKGAFTGASRDFKGAFERADGGTLLLDEIGDMDLRSQTRLLRVLQEGKVRRLGGDEPIPVDVRVVAATNRDLALMVRERMFREDLYYRIHVCPLILPSLRERGADRIILFEHFLQQQSFHNGRSARALIRESRERLLQEAFPGNVRQLQNVVRRLLVQRTTGPTISLEEIEKALLHAAQVAPISITAPTPEPVEQRESVVVEVVEEFTEAGAWVVEQLRHYGFNFTKAAKALQQERMNGASRTQVPVQDRGALDYYLCGEFFQCLADERFDLEKAIHLIAGGPRYVPRVRRKIRSYLRPLEAITDQAAADIVQEHYRRIPESYHHAIEQCIHDLKAQAKKKERR